VLPPAEGCRTGVTSSSNVFVDGNGIVCGTGYNGGQLFQTMATKEYLG
jgi:hypothetical protein